MHAENGLPYTSQRQSETPHEVAACRMLSLRYLTAISWFTVQDIERGVLGNAEVHVPDSDFGACGSRFQVFDCETRALNLASRAWLDVPHSTSGHAAPHLIVFNLVLAPLLGPGFINNHRVLHVLGPQEQATKV